MSVRRNSNDLSIGMRNWTEMHRFDVRASDCSPEKEDIHFSFVRKPYEAVINKDKLDKFQLFKVNVDGSPETMNYRLFMDGINNRSHICYEIADGDIISAQGAMPPKKTSDSLGMTLSEKKNILNSIALGAEVPEFIMMSAGKYLYRFIAPWQFQGWFKHMYDSQSVVLTPGIGVKASYNTAFISFDGEKMLTARGDFWHQYMNICGDIVCLEPSGIKVTRADIMKQNCEKQADDALFIERACGAMSAGLLCVSEKLSGIIGKDSPLL